MTDRELLQQALDMLDDINQCSLPPTGIPLPAEIDHVMKALRARLAQPKREWVGLTDAEYEAMAEQYVTNCYFDTLKYAKAIEAKLRDKNS